MLSAEIKQLEIKTQQLFRREYGKKAVFLISTLTINEMDGKIYSFVIEYTYYPGFKKDDLWVEGRVEVIPDLEDKLPEVILNNAINAPIESEKKRQEQII